MIAGDLAEALRTACAEVGVMCCEVPADGQWYAADIEGDPRGRGDGRIKLFADGEGGIVTNWKEGNQRVFFVGNGRKLTEPERQERDRKREQAIREAEVEAQRRHAEARAQAAAIWRAAQPAAADHPYLARKGVKPVATLRELPADQLTALLSYIPKSKGEPLAGRVFLVPIKLDDELASLEFIDEAGRKSALAGGAKRRGYWAAHALPEGGGDGLTLVLGEGVATCLSAYEATGYPVIAALSSTNLEPVAKSLYSRFPGAKLIILADLLRGTSEPDPHAIAAARMVDALLAVPQFADVSSGPTDFNDLHRLEGAEAVRRCIGAAKPAEAPQAEVSSSEWPEPRPIRAALYPVPAFDAETLLPEALRGWVMDEADRMPCSPDFLAAAVLVALGTLMGARWAIKPKIQDDWFEVLNFWGGIVGLPASKKTAAMGKALKPLDRLIAQAFKTHEKNLELYEDEKLLFQVRKEAIENRLKAAAKGKGDETLESIANELREHQRNAPEAPVLKRYKTNDSTVAKLGELLRDNPAGLLVMRDELVGLLVNWECEGREGDRQFFLEGWNGTLSYNTDRIGRGEIAIENNCISIFGGIQPDKLIRYLEQTAHALANDGMLQRFQILVYPDHRPWDWRDRLPDKQARDRVFALFETLADLDPLAWGAQPPKDPIRFPYFQFDERAQEVFIEWSGDLHRTRLPAEDNPIINQHLAKYDKLFPALALVLHLVDCVDTGERGQVTPEAALRAAAWCEYLEAHARRCYGLLADDGLRAAQALSDKVRQGRLVDGFTARDVRRNQWRSLTNEESVQAALDWLEDEGWLRGYRDVKGQAQGKSAWRYSINPKIAQRRN